MCDLTGYGIVCHVFWISVCVPWLRNPHVPITSGGERGVNIQLPRSRRAADLEIAAPPTQVDVPTASSEWPAN